MQTTDMTEAFSALGDKTRFQLYKMLSNESEFCVSQLAHELNITPACVSQHMKILAEAGLVTRVREGQRVCYKVAKESKLAATLNKLVFSE